MQASDKVRERSASNTGKCDLSLPKSCDLAFRGIQDSSVGLRGYGLGSGSAPVRSVCIQVFAPKDTLP